MPPSCGACSSSPNRMPDATNALSPAVIAIAAVVILVALIAGALLARRAGRSPRAWETARREAARAGEALARLDDAVTELDVEAAVTVPDVPDDTRRARMAAQHARDRGFSAYRVLLDESPTPASMRRGARSVLSHARTEAEAVSRARAAHEADVLARASGETLLVGARERFERVCEAIGDPDVLVSELRGRFAEAEWTDAADAATRCWNALNAAASHLDDSPVTDAAGTWAVAVAAGRAQHEAEEEARRLEHLHRASLQSAANAPQELTELRADLRAAAASAAERPSAAADRVLSELTSLEAAAATLDTAVAEHPTAAVDDIARVRAALDRAAHDLRAAPQRLRAARSALPGTLSAARATLAHAEGAASRGSIDARVRLAGARRELARAREADDPQVALVAARRAMRLADDARKDAPSPA